MLNWRTQTDRMVKSKRRQERKKRGSQSRLGHTTMFGLYFVYLKGGDEMLTRPSTSNLNQNV